MRGNGLPGIDGDDLARIWGACQPKGVFMNRHGFARTVLARLRFALARLARSAPSDRKVRRLLAKRVDQAKQATGIVLGIIGPGGRRIVSHGTLGLDDERLANGDTVFEIGSVTKVFTALLLADMARRGEVALNDSVAKYLPSPLAEESSTPTTTVPWQGLGQITLADLATHTSGLPSMPDNFHPGDWTNPHADYSVEQLYEFLSRVQPVVHPGAKYIYSNVGFGLLGRALSCCAGRSFEELVRSRITDPLGMHDTRSNPSDSMKQRLAKGHDANLSAAASWKTSTLEGAGGLRSTANDLMTLLEAFVGLRPTPLRAATRAMLEFERTGGLRPCTHTGLGWMIIRSGAHRVVWHGGRTGGYRAFMGYNPSTKVGVVALANASTQTGADDIALHLLDRRFPMANPQPARQRMAIAIDPRMLDSYVGRYRISSTLTLNITRSRNRLYVQTTSQKKQELFAESERQFFLRTIDDVQLSFDAAAEGPAPALTVYQGGWEQRAFRIR